MSDRYDFYFLFNIKKFLPFQTAKDAMQDGRSPVIIDNTNLQAWEMKPYVKMVSTGFYLNLSVWVMCTTLPLQVQIKMPYFFKTGFGEWIQS